MQVGCDASSIAYCCGFYTAGDFREGENARWADHKESSPEKLVQQLMNHAEGRPILFNFVKEAIIDEDGDEQPTGEFESSYLCDSLRQYVKAHKAVIDIGSWINPGTHNKIHGYILKDYL
jgi:hypothetical protein